jgi:hypothetical protein
MSQSEITRVIGRHTAANFSEMIAKSLSLFEIPHIKIHMLLRDAASNMKATANALEFASADCLAHKLLLV